MSLPRSYNPDHFARLAAIEQKHFWFTARRNLIRAAVRRISAKYSPGYRVIEVGCGTGNVLTALQEECPSAHVYGMDLFHEGLAFAKRNGAHRVLQGNASHPPFSVLFDIVGAFDVVEHIADDAGVLRCFHRMLRPGGTVLLTVPAYQWLWSEFDELSDHQRRYAPPELAEKLRAAGFVNISVSPFMMLTLPLMWLHRKKRRSAGENGARRDAISEEIRIVPGVNEILRAALNVEMSIASRGIKLPFGTSLLAIAHKQ